MLAKFSDGRFRVCYHDGVLKILGHVSVAIILTIAFTSALFLAALLFAVQYFAPPSFSTSLATVQNVSASAWLVFDAESGEIIYEYNADDTLPVASITKLIAAKTFYDSNNIWATTTITWSDLNGDGRAGKLAYGEIYDFHTLLFPLLLESSNDAAKAFSRNDVNLIEKMDSYARSLNLYNTSFADASGLSAGNVSTAREIKTIVSDIYRFNRHLMDITSLNQYLTSQTGWLNNNPFASDADFQGGKHGYTPEAGHTAAVLFNEALKNGAKRSIGYILLDSGNLEYDVKLLRDHVKNSVSFE